MLFFSGVLLDVEPEAQDSQRFLQDLWGLDVLLRIYQETLDVQEGDVDVLVSVITAPSTQTRGVFLSLDLRLEEFFIQAFVHFASVPFTWVDFTGGQQNH